MNQRARARRAYLEVNPGPWTCHFCGQPVVLGGKGREGGVVHHVNEDGLDNSDENIVAAHRGCHVSHHQSKKNSSPFPKGERRRGFGCGHPETPENIYLRPDGGRECRICKRRRAHPKKEVIGRSTRL